MYALKDKVSNRLSRLLSDSPNSPSSSSSSPLSPASPPENPQARQFAKGKLISSYFAFPVPSLNFSGSRSEKKHELKPIQSDPVRWSHKKFDLQDEGSSPIRYHECCTTSDNEETQKSSDDSEEPKELKENKQTGKTQDNSEASSSDNDVFEEAHEHETPKPLPQLMDESVFISPELYEFLQSSLPNIVRGCQWTLLYSTLKHGISLRTLIRKSADTSGLCLLIVGDKQGAVFGGLLESPLRPTPKRKYQGTNQSFIFTTIYGAPRLFRPTGANRYFYMCLNDLLALGGGNFALSLDGDLLNGTSGPCETYGSLCLAHNSEFEPKNVELWGFTHASKYLT